ncbi:MAG: tetratricopeptide repeat protein [Labilithrix sp.]|nr:tetratricopeptide repeat protein [Labilithrix sp.]MCW5816211.1 tetratricopeptide repeat protein [Labilithrix sp.]
MSMAPAGFAAVDRRTPLVGRAEELAALEAALAAVRDEKRGRAVTIVGPAGIGKTRLVRDFLSRQRKLPVGAPRVFRGSAREGGGAYDVFARVLRARFGIVEGMEPEVAKAQVRAQVAEVLEDRKVGDVCFFLGQILELEFMDSPLIQAVRKDASQMRLLRRAVIKRFLEADGWAGQKVSVGEQPSSSSLPAAAPVRDTDREIQIEIEIPGEPKAPRAPCVLVFDDLQFAHDESLDLLGRLLDTLDAPILMICIARPEMVARRDDWVRPGAKRHDLIELSPLTEEEAEEVMYDLLEPCGDVEGKDELVGAATSLAAGNPALLERMLALFRDMRVIEETDQFKEHSPWQIHLDRLAQVSLPLTVEDAIQARIGALAPEERDLLEQAAMMGSVFWLGGLVAMARLDTPVPDVWSAEDAKADVAHIRAMLAELKERDYILSLPDGTFPDDEEMVFKHNLERETLLKLLPRAQARRLHRSIADWLSFKPNVRTHEEYMGMLAHHQEEAGLYQQAASTYLDAAHLARDRYAYGRAAEYYGKGLGLLRDGAEAGASEQLRSLHHYGDVLQLLGRADEAHDCYTEMLVRAYRLDLPAKGGAAHGRIGRLYRDTGRLDDAKGHLEAALALFEAAGDERGIASTVDDLGKLFWLRGDYEQALGATQRALGLRRKLGDRRSIALSLNNLGLVHQDAGQFTAALDAFEQALRIRREIGDLVGVSISLNNLGTVAQDQKDDKRALSLFLEAYEIAKETGDKGRIALVLTNLGETYNRLGDPQKAIHYLAQAESITEELGDKTGLGEAVRGLGKAHLAMWEYARAQEYAERAVEIFRETKAKVQLGVALRSLGEIMGAAGGDGVLAARGHLLQSVWIFEEIGNDVELARSCRLYAALLRASPDFHTDPVTAREATQFTERADAIFEKLESRAADAGARR